MNGRSVGPPNPGGDQSALSLLVNAADSRDNPGARRDGGGGAGSLADTLRLRGFGGGEPSFEEQFMLQQQAQSLLGGGGGGSSMLLSQLRDQGLLSQLGGSLGGGGNQNQQLAALLGLGGGSSHSNDVRSALAAQLRQSQQQQQQQQLSHADILALSRSGALSSSGLAGLMSRMGGGGGMSAFGGSGLASELENLQRLEELERRQRLMNAGLGGSSALAQQQASAASANAAQNTMDSSGGIRGSVLRNAPGPGDDRMSAVAAAHLSRPSPASEIINNNAGTSSSPKPKPSSPPSEHHLRQRAVQQQQQQQHSRHDVLPPTAAVPTEANKEELEKTPGSVIVPCRARGMPMDHNFKVRCSFCLATNCRDSSQKEASVFGLRSQLFISLTSCTCIVQLQTAYFVIPENVKHGEELICSYFACRNAGIKFRYCSHCKVPVAKRNFRKRHKHGGEDIPRGAGDDSGGEEEPSVKKGIPAHITADQDQENDALSSQSADSNPQEKSDLGVRQGLVQSSMRTFEKKKQPQVPEAPEESVTGAKISMDRKERWAALLGKRPATKDGDSMSAWLMEVLAVSDLDTPLKSMEGGAPAAGGAMPADAFPAPATPAAVASPSGKDEDTKEPASSSLPPKKEKVTSPFRGGIVKKKRPAPEVAKKDVAAKSSGTELVSGSFAEWKERKKAKKQAKMNPTQEAEV